MSGSTHNQMLNHIQLSAVVLLACSQVFTGSGVIVLTLLVSFLANKISAWMKLLSHACVTSTCVHSSRCVFFFFYQRRNYFLEFSLDNSFSFGKSASELVTLHKDMK